MPEQRSDDKRVVQREAYLFENILQMAADHMGCRDRKQIHRTGKNRSDTIRRNTSDQVRDRVTASRNSDLQGRLADRAAKQCESGNNQPDYANGGTGCLTRRKPNMCT